MKNTLTKLDKLYLILRVWFEKERFSGRIEIHVNQGHVRNVVKIESIQIAD